MSTRACIARKTPKGFKGTYHHWDGYPHGLGMSLFELYLGHFQKDLSLMLKTLIDDHPAGWSSIVDADFALEPGFEEKVLCATCGKEFAFDHQEEEGHEFERSRRPRCYCHGDRNEEAGTVTHRNAAGDGCEWAYVFEIIHGKDVMHVLSSYSGSPGIGSRKMIGYFGSGDGKAAWIEVAAITLSDGLAPDWKEIERGDREPSEMAQEKAMSN